MKTGGKTNAEKLAVLQQQIIDACIQIGCPEKVSKGITIKTMLKRDLDLEIYEFGNLLAEVFDETGWVDDYGEIIDKYNTTADLSIEELAEQLMFKK